MVLRLAVVGVVLIIGGVVNVGGFRMVTLPLGAVLLVASGILWLMRRNSSSAGR